jgi:hypothetical protein
MNMKKSSREPTPLPVRQVCLPAEASITAPSGVATIATVNQRPVNSRKRLASQPSEKTSSLPTGVAEPGAPSKVVNRGLAATISTNKLRQAIWLRALLLANRFRVIRTLDVAVLCAPERPFKAALTAAQRAVRGMVKAELLTRYRSDRFQTIYGINQKGVTWLEEAGYDASSSVRRVSDMTNPEHRLWAQFWTLACEARGLSAMSEQELLQHLNKGTTLGQPLVQGYLTVSVMRGGKSSTIQLRPDAVAHEADGTTWLEVDRSKRGSDREASLGALASAVGRILKDGTTLRRVVIFCKTERIRKRAVAVLNALALANNSEVLLTGRRHFCEMEPGVYEIWKTKESALSDGRTELVDTMAGHVIIQMLPIWLPKVRIDASNTHSTAGWFGENYLPYKRPECYGAWGAPLSPLLSPIKG